MIVLLLSAIAWADDAARLLGPEPVAATPPPPAAPSVSWTSFWPVLLAGGLAAGMWLWQRRARGEGGQELAAFELVGRFGLGGANLLHLVDVEDRTGRLRRLVIATSGAGPAQLVVDLGSEPADDEAAAFVPRAAAPPRAPPPQRTTGETWAARIAEPGGSDLPDPWAGAERNVADVRAPREDRSTPEDRSPRRPGPARSDGAARVDEAARPDRERRAERSVRREEPARSAGAGPSERPARPESPPRATVPMRDVRQYRNERLIREELAREESSPGDASDRRAQTLSLIDEVVGTREAPPGRRGLRA